MTSEKVTPDPLAARVHALIAQWRELAENLAPYATALNTPYAVTWLKRCANELEAALAAALAPPISTDEQVDIFVHRLELLLYRRTGNTWELNQLRAVRALFRDVLAAAALAPQPEQE